MCCSRPRRLCVLLCTHSDPTLGPLYVPDDVRRELATQLGLKRVCRSTCGAAYSGGAARRPPTQTQGSGCTLCPEHLFLAPVAVLGRTSHPRHAGVPTTRHRNRTSAFAVRVAATRFAARRFLSRSLSGHSNSCYIHEHDVARAAVTHGRSWRRARRVPAPACHTALAACPFDAMQLERPERPGGGGLDEGWSRRLQCRPHNCLQCRPHTHAQLARSDTGGGRKTNERERRLSL